MDPLEQLRKDNNCLKEQIMFLLKYCLAATSWSPNHTSANNNKYQKGTLVWYEDYVYECLVANNSIPVNNEYYWHKINLGHLLAQEVPISTTPGPGIYSFVSPLVEENEVVSILQAAIDQDGYLSAIDWETFNNKQNALPVGDSSQYLKGDLTLGTFPSIPTKTSDLTNDGSDGTNPFITANVLTPTITDGDITHAPDGNAVFDALALKLDKNSSITGATKTKITYDSNGLVTSGADATTADIADSTNKRYVTDAQVTIINNTSGINSGNETVSTLGATINSSASATPNDTDLVTTVESSVVKKITWTNVKAFLKTYFDTVYTTTSAVATQITTALSSYITSATAASTFMSKSANGSDIANIKTFRANLGVDKLTQNGDSNYTILSTDKVVVTSAVFTLPRTWTLPLANSVNAGYEIIIADLFGGLTSTNNLVISRSGSDTINGFTALTISAAYGMRRLISDGVSSWTFDAGVMRVSDYIGTTLTASKIVATDSNSKLQPLDTATYPSLTELSYGKGVTSSIQPQIDAVNVNVITITTSISIDTDTTSGGYGQHGRHNKISNGANAINLTVQTSSNADFVASYEKIGSSTITFVAGSGATLVQLSGTALLSGAVGSKACLSRNGNTYYLQITNY